MTQKTLAGLRVVDFSWVLAGPMTTKMLAGMGAEIIKIESSTRREHTQRQPWWAVVNAGKKSCTINLSQPQGPELIRRLIAQSDMVVENFSNGVLAKFGLDYATLAKIRADLIFVSASGTGREGPQRDSLAYGSLLQAYSGRASVVGTLNERVEAMGILPAWTDPITALWESCAVLAAIRHRRVSGEGAYIDLSMLESTVALLPELLFREALGSETPTATGAAEASGRRAIRMLPLRRRRRLARRLRERRPAVARPLRRHAQTGISSRFPLRRCRQPRHAPRRGRRSAGCVAARSTARARARCTAIPRRARGAFAAHRRGD